MSKQRLKECDAPPPIGSYVGVIIHDSGRHYVERKATILAYRDHTPRDGPPEINALAVLSDQTTEFWWNLCLLNADGQDGHKHRSAPSQEGHAAGPACSAPDEGAIRDQSDAWFAVCAALNEVDPAWTSRTKRGMDSAVLAIKTLAEKADSRAPDEALIEEIAELAESGYDLFIVHALPSDQKKLVVEMCRLAIREYIRRSAGKEKE